MSEKQQEVWDKLCELSGETVAQLFTDYHGTQLLSDGFREHLQVEGYLDADPEDECCGSCLVCGVWRTCGDYGLYD